MTAFLRCIHISVYFFLENLKIQKTGWIIFFSFIYLYIHVVYMIAKFPFVDGDCFRLCWWDICMLVSINPVYVMQSKMINVCNNLLIQKRNKLAIGFLCHLQAHRNCTLLVGWFVYLLVVWDLKKQKNVLSNNWKGMLNLLGVGCAGKW